MGVRLKLHAISVSALDKYGWTVLLLGRFNLEGSSLWYSLWALRERACESPTEEEKECEASGN
jgi:hypothetical protein